MGYLGRRIGLSQDSGDSNPGGADGAVGGGLLDLFAHGYFERQGDLYNAPGIAPQGMSATGGIISDYADPGSGYIYRAHTFTSSGTLVVSDLGNTGNTSLDWLIVAGGGSGGGNIGGGGGAGGLRTSMPEGPGGPSPSSEAAITATVRTYTVTVGAGANRVMGDQPGVQGTQGSPSSITYSPGSLVSTGGGGGGAGASNSHQSSTGGSGGGNGGYSPGNTPAAAGTSGQGYPGGAGPTTYFSGGGGGSRCDR